MAKNKGKYRSREGGAEEEQLPVEQLQTLTSRTFEVLRPHAVKLAAIVGGVALILIGFGIWSWYDGKQEAEATRLFSQATKILEAKVDPPAPDPAAPADPATPAPPADPADPSDPGAKKASDEPSYKTRQARSEAALAVLDRIEREHGSTDVARQARLGRAGLLYDLGRFDEAAEAYRKYLDGADGRLRIVAAEGLGYSLEAKAMAEKDEAARKAGLDQALDAFGKIQPDDKGLWRDVALYHQARVTAAKGDKPAALTLYKQILERWPTTHLKQDVTARIAALEG